MIERKVNGWASWWLCPQTPGIYRIVAKGKWQVPGGRLAASTPIALAFGIDSAQCCFCQEVASQHCPILRSSTFSIPCSSLLCTNFCTQLQNGQNILTASTVSMGKVVRRYHRIGISPSGAHVSSTSTRLIFNSDTFESF